MTEKNLANELGSPSNAPSTSNAAIANTQTALTSPAATTAAVLNGVADNKTHNEKKEITIILMGGSHEDPTPCFFLSQYIKQNITKIQNVGLKIEMGFESNTVNIEDNKLDLKIKSHISKIVEWVQKTRLKLVNGSSSSCSYTQAEIVDFIINDTDMDNMLKRFFLKKIYEDINKFSAYINMWNARNEGLARKAHVNLFQQLSKNNITGFPLEPVPNDEPDYVSAIFEKIYSGEDHGVSKVEKNRIDRMVNSIGQSIRNLEKTGGLIVIPSLGLSHMHRLEANISIVFKDYPIKIKSFEIKPPNYGVLIRHNILAGNEKHWISDITAEARDVSKKRINEVDTDIVKEYYQKNPYTEVMIEQNVNGEFFCPPLAEYLDSVILRCSKLYPEKENLGEEVRRSQLECQLLQKSIIEKSLIKNRVLVNDCIVGDQYRYSLKFKDSTVCCKITQAGHARSGVFLVGVKFGYSNKAMTLLRINKSERYDFNLGRLSAKQETGTFELVVTVIPVPNENYHGVGLPSMTVGDKRYLVGPKEIFRFDCNGETVWVDQALPPEHDIFYPEVSTKNPNVSFETTNPVPPSAMPTIKPFQSEYETLPLENSSIIKWRNPVIQEFIIVAEVLGGLSYSIQAGVRKRAEDVKDSVLAVKVTEFGYSDPGELWVGIRKGEGKPILTLLKLYKKKGQDFYINFQSLFFSKEKDSEYCKMEPLVAIFNTPLENYFGKAYGGKIYKQFTVDCDFSDNWQDDPFYPPEVFGEKPIDNIVELPQSVSTASVASRTSIASTASKVPTAADETNVLNGKDMGMQRTEQSKPKEDTSKMVPPKENTLLTEKADAPYTTEDWQLQQYKGKLIRDRNTSTGVTKYTIKLLDQESNAASNTASFSTAATASASTANASIATTATAATASAAAALNAKAAAANHAPSKKPRLALKAAEVGSSMEGNLEVGIKENGSILPLFKVKKTEGHDFKINPYSINSERTEINFSVVRVKEEPKKQGKPFQLYVDTSTWKEGLCIKEIVHSPTPKVLTS